MDNALINAVVTIVAGITGVALIAVLVSKNANTSGVLQAGGSAYSQSLATALSPITGGGIGNGGGLSYAA